MFTPVSQMPAVLRAHLRYPEDLLTVQSAMYGRYHITQPLAFYNATNAWNVSPDCGAGIARPGAAADVHHQRPGASAAPARCTGWHRSTSSSRFPASSAAVVQPGRRLRPGVQGRSDPDHVRRSSWPARIPRTTASSPCSRRHPSTAPPWSTPTSAATQAISPRSACSTRTAPASCWGTSRSCRWATRCCISGPSTWSRRATPSPSSTTTSSSTRGRRGRAGRLRPDAVGGAPGPVQGVTAQSGRQTRRRQRAGPGTVSPQVQTLIAQANTEFQQAQTDLKAGNFAAYGTDVSSLQNVLQQLQQASTPSTTIPAKSTSGSGKSSSTSTTPHESTSTTSTTAARGEASPRRH